MQLLESPFLGLIKTLLLYCRDKLMEHGVHIRIIGNLNLLPVDLQKMMAKAMFITRNNSKAVLNIAYAYTGECDLYTFWNVWNSYCSAWRSCILIFMKYILISAREEITQCVKQTVEGVVDGVLSPSNVTQDLLSKTLYTNHSPTPDLLIRTSGEVRLSDFLLWQVWMNSYFGDSRTPTFYSHYKITHLPLFYCRYLVVVCTSQMSSGQISLFGIYWQLFFTISVVINILKMQCCLKNDLIRSHQTKVKTLLTL